MMRARRTAFRKPGTYTSAKLSMAQVREIRARYAGGGVTQKELSAEYGISPTQMNRLLTNKTYKERHDQG